ncbi:MAG: sigma-70 family RNA polymerase sigma factor, partial [Chloroflexi bacterium]|nr:sigma-70 family RNA polymerase sigma factor [Chloroflexota bacterium]
MSEAPTDAELVIRAQRGELDAYGELVERYQQLVIRAAFVVTRNSADAEDVGQEALLKAYAALRQVDPESFRPWLLRIVLNQARNHLTAARRRAGLIERAAWEGQAAQSGPSPEASMLAAEQRAVLTRALDELREEDRLAIAYRYFFDLSETEMVESLGWPRGTVKSRLSRALGRYRQVLGELALLPIGTFTWSPQAAELARWSEAQLEHGLANLGAQALPLPTHDLSIGLVQQLHALGTHPTSSGASLLTSTRTVALAGAFVAALAVAAVFARPTPRAAPPSVVPVATPAPAATPQSTSSPATVQPALPPPTSVQPQATP